MLESFLASGRSWVVSPGLHLALIRNVQSCLRLVEISNVAYGANLPRMELRTPSMDRTRREAGTKGPFMGRRNLKWLYLMALPHGVRLKCLQSL